MALVADYVDKHMRTMELIVAAKSGDHSAMDILLKENTRLIYKVVNRFKYNSHFDSDDLFQIGVLGFLKAAQNFNTDSGVKLSTYAVPVIHGEIARSIRDLGYTIRFSRKYYPILTNYSRVCSRLEQELRRSPTFSEIADELGIEPSELEKVFQISSIASLDAPIELSDSIGDTLLDLVPDTKSPVFDFAGVELHEAIDSLPEKIRTVIILRYLEDKTQSEVGNLIGVSQVQVSRLEKRGINLLRDRLNKIKESEINLEAEVRPMVKNTAPKKKITQIYELFDNGETVQSIAENLQMKEGTIRNYYYRWKRLRGHVSDGRNCGRGTRKKRKTKESIVINHVLVDITLNCGSILRNCAIFLEEACLNPLTDVKLINELFEPRPYAHFINYRGNILGGRLNQKDIKKFTITYIPDIA